MQIARSTYDSMTEKVQEHTEQLVKTMGQECKQLTETISLRKTKLLLKYKMDRAKSYAEWRTYAEEYDQIKSTSPTSAPRNSPHH